MPSGRRADWEGRLVAPQDARLPHADRPGEACRGEESSVGTERDAKDLAWPGAQRLEQDVASRVPQLDRPARSRWRACRLGTERDAIDGPPSPVCKVAIERILTRFTRAPNG